LYPVQAGKAPEKQVRAGKSDLADLTSLTENKNHLFHQVIYYYFIEAEATGLEPAISALTGQYVNRLHHASFLIVSDIIHVRFEAVKG
jgi:hypothetical protein